MNCPKCGLYMDASVCPDPLCPSKHRIVSNNISLRDEIAMRALQGIISGGDDRYYNDNDEETLEEWRKRLRLEDANLAYGYADALIAQREK